jgi:hypothetical protein
MNHVKEYKYTCGEISGTLRDTWSDTICLMVHGFQSNSKSRLMRNYAVSLANRWVTSLRVDLYNSNNRNLMNTDLENHILDIEWVITDISTRYKSVIYIGHSLWWAIWWLITNSNLVSWMLLWDSAIPSIVKFETFLEEIMLQDIEYLRVARSRNWIISKSYWEQLSNFDENYFLNIACPYLAICCEQVWFYNHISQFNDSKKSRKTILIPWSSHNFQERWAEEKLFSLSNTFIDTILK